MYMAPHYSEIAAREVVPAMFACDLIDALFGQSLDCWVSLVPGSKTCDWPATSC